eukprot:403367065
MMSQGLRLFQNRGLHLLLSRPAVMAQQRVQAFSVYNYESRDFSKKNKGGKRSAQSASDVEGDTPQQEQRQPAQDFSAAASQAADTNVPIDRALFTPFSLGDVKKIQSTPDNQPPSKEDTIPGRYATVLFTTASQEGKLYEVYEDMVFIGQLYENSESFQQFTQNAGVGLKEIRLFNQSLLETGADIAPVTTRFLEVLGENKRLMFIKEVTEKFQKLYQQFNKEEKITIISAYQLSGEEEQQVLSALKSNPQNQGKEFQLEFKQDPSILGGLQMYTESEFMDMSLQSRLDKIHQEVNKLIN